MSRLERGQLAGVRRWAKRALVRGALALGLTPIAVAAAAALAAHRDEDETMAVVALGLCIAIGVSYGIAQVVLGIVWLVRASRVERRLDAGRLPVARLRRRT